MNLEGQVKKVQVMLPELDCASAPHIELMSGPHFRFNEFKSPEVKVKYQYFQCIPQVIQNHSQI